MRFLRWLIWLAVVVLVLLLAAGFTGYWHPAGDSFGVFRAQGAAAMVACGALAAFLRMPKLGASVVILAASVSAPVLYAYLRSRTPGDLVLYQKNLLFRGADLAAIAADIAEAAPDFITLQEVSTRNRLLLGELREDYPTQQFCSFTGVGGTVAISKYPAIPGTAVCVRGLSAVQVAMDDGPLWVISIHLHWPWPYGQAAQVRELSALIAGMRGPKIIGGDFNMAPWSHAMRQIAEAGDVQFARPTRGSYAGFAPWLMLPIDHVLAPAGGQTELRPLLGSDHHGLLVRFGLPQPDSAASNG
jgi:endonuclease/exonuclease/phosphatase (EEP) superfamily protein YafD